MKSPYTIIAIATKTYKTKMCVEGLFLILV
jgi:hypothetical protein